MKLEISEETMQLLVVCVFVLCALVLGLDVEDVAVLLAVIVK